MTLTYIIHEHASALHALNARASCIRIPARLADQILVALAVAHRAHRIASQTPHRDHASLRALDDEVQSARRHRGLEYLRGRRQHVRQRQLGTDRQQRMVAEDLAIIARQQQLQILLLLLRAATELANAVAESEELEMTRERRTNDLDDAVFLLNGFVHGRIGLVFEIGEEAVLHVCVFCVLTSPP